MFFLVVTKKHKGINKHPNKSTLLYNIILNSLGVLLELSILCNLNLIGVVHNISKLASKIKLHVLFGTV